MSGEEPTAPEVKVEEPLTAKQRQVIALIEVGGYTHRQIGQMVGVSVQSVRQLRERAIRNLERAQPAADPNAWAAPVLGPKADLPGRDPGDLFEKLLLEILGSIRADDLVNASLQQKLVAIGITTDKLLLWRGRPTQRISVEDSRQLPQLMQWMLVELEKRGISAEGVPTLDIEASTPK